MELSQVAIILSAISSLIAILTAGATAIYAFAVIRTEVSQVKNDIKLLHGHTANMSVHFNEAAFVEFRHRMEDNFKTFEKQLDELKGYCSDIERKIDAMRSDGE